MALTATYQPVETPVFVENDTAVIAAEEVPLSASGVPLANILLAITAAATLGSLVYLFALRLRPFKVCYKVGDKVKVMQRRPIKRTEHYLVVRVRADADLSLEQGSFGVLPSRYHGSAIEVYQRDELVYDGVVLDDMPLLNVFDAYEALACEAETA
jgi:hypothetical protein